jgi:hypothetical protein
MQRRPSRRTDPARKELLLIVQVCGHPAPLLCKLASRFPRRRGGRLRTWAALNEFDLSRPRLVAPISHLRKPRITRTIGFPLIAKQIMRMTLLIMSAWRPRRHSDEFHPRYGQYHLLEYIGRGNPERRRYRSVFVAAVDYVLARRDRGLQELVAPTYLVTG